MQHAGAVTGTALVGDDGTIRYANDDAAALLGRDREALLRCSLLDLLAHDERDGARQMLERSRTSPDVGVRGRFRLTGSDGAHWIEITLTNLPAVGAIVVSILDATHLVRAAERLAVQDVAAHALSGAATLEDAAPRILSAICEHLRWDRAELWQPIRQGGEPDVFLRCVDARQAAPGPPVSAVGDRGVLLAAGHGVPGRVWATGAETWFPDLVADSEPHMTTTPAEAGLRAAFALPVRMGGEVGVMALYRRQPIPPDVHQSRLLESLARQIALYIDRARAEAALHEREELYRLITDSSTDLIAVLDFHGRTVYASPSARVMMGYAPDDLSGVDAFTFIHPEDAPASGEAFQRAIRGETVTFAHRARHSNGEWRWLDGWGKMISYQGAPHLLAVSRDVTERKRLEEQFRQAQKMEAVGQLAGGVAHDFNNLLTVINGYADIVLGQLATDDGTRELLGELKSAGDRAAQLTRQLLAFSRKQALHPRSVDVNALIQESSRLVRPLLGDEIELTVSTEADPPTIFVDPGHFEHALINLVTNARDAMGRAGRLTISTSNVELDDAFTSLHHGLVPGRYVKVTVEDTGEGMDETTKAHIFEPFFTTKERGEGTGLGLSIVYGFIKQSGGHIEALSEPGHGTTFCLYLRPAESEPHRTAESPPDLADDSWGNETVLLVDDEPAVRLLCRRVLESRGYRVIEAEGSEAALGVADRHDGPIHLLLTDVVMPRISGPRLARQLVERRAGLKVLFMSGYADDTLFGDGGWHPGGALLHKPFATRALLRRVREILDGG